MLVSDLLEKFRAVKARYYRQQSAKIKIDLDVFAPNAKLPTCLIYGAGQHNCLFLGVGANENNN